MKARAPFALVLALALSGAYMKKVSLIALLWSGGSATCCLAGQCCPGLDERCCQPCGKEECFKHGRVC